MRGNDRRRLRCGLMGSCRKPHGSLAYYAGGSAGKNLRANRIFTSCSARKVSLVLRLDDSDE